MKKNIFAVLALALLSVSCGTIKIAMDSRMEDGDRVILTSDVRVFGDVSVALGAKISPKDTVLAVLVTYDGRTDHGVFDVDDKILFRLKDQSVITLLNVYQREFEKETETYTTNERRSSYGFAYAYDPYMMDIYVTPVEVSSFVPRVHTRTMTKSYGLYFISKPQLMEIIEKGVIKMRVEIEDDELDMPSGATDISALFAGQYACLKERFDYVHKRSEF